MAMGIHERNALRSNLLQNTRVYCTYRFHLLPPGPSPRVWTVWLVILLFGRAQFYAFFKLLFVVIQCLRC